ncbi:MAG: sterol desaturase, partial [Bacteroidota bacterium]
KQLGNYGFLWQHFHYWMELSVAMKRTNGLRAKLQILFGKPDMVDPSIRPALERKFNINPSTGSFLLQERNRYVLWQIIATLLVLFIFILLEHMITMPIKIILAGLILTTLINCGAMLERRPWAFHIELIRLFILGMGLAMFLPPMETFTVFLIIAGAIILYFKTLQNYYLRYVYDNI